MDLTNKTEFELSEEERERYQFEEAQNKKKNSPLRKFFKVIANIFTFGVYGKIQQAKAEKQAFYEASNPDEEPVVEPVSKEEIDKETDTSDKGSGEVEKGTEVASESPDNDKNSQSSEVKGEEEKGREL